MKNVGYILVVVGGLLNIALNLTVKQAASEGQQYLASLFTRQFLVAFCIGLCSIACLVGVYISNINLSRGILMMGATSILGGTLVGVLVRHEKLSVFDWLLFCAIAFFYVCRLARGLLNQN